MSVGFKVYRGEDVDRSKYERFEDEKGQVVWARFVWGEGVYLNGMCVFPPGWSWGVLGWGSFSESAMMWPDVCKTKDAARTAFAKRFKLTATPAEDSAAVPA